MLLLIKVILIIVIFFYIGKWIHFDLRMRRVLNQANKEAGKP